MCACTLILFSTYFTSSRTKPCVCESLAVQAIKFIHTRYKYTDPENSEAACTPHKVHHACRVFTPTRHTYLHELVWNTERESWQHYQQEVWQSIDEFPKPIRELHLWDGWWIKVKRPASQHIIRSKHTSRWNPCIHEVSYRASSQTFWGKRIRRNTDNVCMYECWRVLQDWSKQKMWAWFSYVHACMYTFIIVLGARFEKQ